MKISKRGEYALRAMIELGIASELGQPLLRAPEIVARENLPKGFLDQILMRLRQDGLIATKRGRNGGYFLNQPMDSISIGQVIRLMDGPLAPIRCVSQTDYQKCSCPDEAHCGLRMLMFDVRNAVSNVLDHYTLADSVRGPIEKMRKDDVALPHEKGAGKKPVRKNQVSQPATATNSVPQPPPKNQSRQYSSPQAKQRSTLSE